MRARHLASTQPGPLGLHVAEGEVDKQLVFLDQRLARDAGHGQADEDDGEAAMSPLAIPLPPSQEYYSLADKMQEKVDDEEPSDVSVTEQPQNAENPRNAEAVEDDELQMDEAVTRVVNEMTDEEVKQVVQDSAVEISQTETPIGNDDCTDEDVNSSAVQISVDDDLAGNVTPPIIEGQPGTTTQIHH